MSGYYVNNERKVYTMERFNTYANGFKDSKVVEDLFYFYIEPIPGLPESFWKPVAIFEVHNPVMDTPLNPLGGHQFYFFNQQTKEIITITDNERIMLADYVNFLRAVDSAYYGTVEQERELERLCTELHLEYPLPEDRSWYEIPLESFPTGLGIMDIVMYTRMH